MKENDRPCSRLIKMTFAPDFGKGTKPIPGIKTIKGFSAYDKSFAGSHKSIAWSLSG
jgi:hypothetical protein